MLRHKILIGLLALAVLLLGTGCEINDPLVDDFYTSASLIRVAGDGSGGYWHEHEVDAFSISPGGSGATLIVAGASTLGGYRLDAAVEYLYFDTHIEDDWDGISDGIIIIYFEVNTDNSGGLVTDSVTITVENYHKLPGARTTTISAHQRTTLVGQAEAHDLFVMTVSIDDLHLTEVTVFRVNLNTILSDVDDIIINYLEFRYPTYSPAAER